MQSDQIANEQTNSSNLLHTQEVSSILKGKYSQDFDFFLVKNINQIIYQKNCSALRTYKDLLDYNEDIEYCKKYYRTKNKNGKEEIKDRMKLLKNFYSSNHMLTYEYPMMTINSLQDMFQKRHKKLAKVNQESESQNQSNQSQDKKNQVIYQKHFNVKEDKYLEDMDWSQIIIGKFDQQHFQENNQNKRTAIQFEEQQQCIYLNQKIIKQKEFLNQFEIGQKSNQHMTFKNLKEDSVDHLIVNFDDLDRVHIIQQYQKLANKQNISIQHNRAKPKEHNKITSFTDIKKPLSSSVFINGDESCHSTPECKRYNNFTQKSMLLGSRQEREKEQQIMKRSSQIETGQRNFIFSQDSIITQNDGDDSPLLGSSNVNKQLSFNIFQPAKVINNQKKQLRDLVKHSQCIQKTSMQLNRQLKRKNSRDSLELLKNELQIIKDKHLKLFGSSNKEIAQNRLKYSKKISQPTKQTQNQLYETSQMTPKSLIRTKSFHALEQHFLD